MITVAWRQRNLGTLRLASVAMLLLVLAPTVPLRGAESDTPSLASQLNEDQRAVVRWTESQFRRFLDQRSPADFPEQDRPELERRLLSALKGPQNAEYFEAINTLAALRSAKAVAPLLQIATEEREKNNRDRWMATRALGLLGERAVVPKLIHLVYFPNANTRWWAQISLVKLTGRNFGTDWENWGRWWNSQKGVPPFEPQKTTWSTNPAWTEPKALEESDRKFISELGPNRPVRPPTDPSR